MEIIGIENKCDAACTARATHVVMLSAGELAFCDHHYHKIQISGADYRELELVG